MRSLSRGVGRWMRAVKSGGRGKYDMDVLPERRIYFQYKEKIKNKITDE